MAIIKTFLTNLKDLMDEKQLSFEKLSEKVKINPRTMRRWYQERSPKLDSLIKISYYFNCSLDYLFGFTDKFDKSSLLAPTSFFSRYKQLKKEKNFKDFDIARMCEIATSTISEWQEKTQPELAVLLKLQNVFDCSLDYLVGISDY